MKDSRLDIFQEFLKLESHRLQMKLTPHLEAMLDYCEYTIHSQFDKNTKGKNKAKKRRQETTHEFRNAFRELNRDQMLTYYIRHGRLLLKYSQGQLEKPNPLIGLFSSDVYSRSFNLKIWKHKMMRLDREKGILYAQKDNKIKTYILQDYIMRKSKSKDFNTFVLQAINKNPHEKSRTVHLGFKTVDRLNEWLVELTQCFQYIEHQFICREMSRVENKEVSSKSEILSARDRTEMQYEESEFSQTVRLPLAKSMVFVSTDKKQEQKYSYSPPEMMNNSQDGSILDSERQLDKSGSQEEEQHKMQRRETIIESIAEFGQEEIEDITDKQQDLDIDQMGKSLKEDIFHRLMPGYDLQQVSETVNYGSLFEQDNLRVLGHLNQPNKIKAILSISSKCTKAQVIEVLTEPEIVKKWNTQVEDLSIKTLIKSENSAMIYQKNKAFNKLYRPRDFIYLRHVFTANRTLYMIDKSIENINYPPFTTIVRGQLCILWAVRIDDDKTTLFVDIMMKNEGYLNDTQNINLALKVLKPLKDLEKQMIANRVTLSLNHIFSEKWDITKQESPKKQPPNLSNQASPQKKDFQPDSSVGFKKNKTSTEQKQPKKPLFEDQVEVVEVKTKPVLKEKVKPIVGPIVVENDKQEKIPELESPFRATLQQNSEMGELDIKEVEQMEKERLKTVHDIVRQFDSEGMVVISNSFCNTVYIVDPLPEEPIKYLEPIEGHPIWKGEWIRDKKQGSIIFINQKKIESQKGVLKFILTKIGKNILSGKSVLNISLPVDIISAQSNLQLLACSFAFAPVFLETAAFEKSSIDKLKKCIAFGISNSPMYLNMEKPFNPILGETFQCWYNGCPVYAEQISHHPPIAAILYEGRGFRMTAQLESKVELHMNSGCGSNDGIFRIKFKDGVQICYITPGGEVSGLTYGDRRFNMVGKSYYWIEAECLFVELVFNPSKKGFFSKQEQPIDYFEGILCQVKPEFFSSFPSKKRAPTDKQIVKKFGKFHGIWNQVSYYDEEVILDIDKDAPAKMEYQANPLPSDSNWREDIAYRRILQITKSQSQKQRLEVLQRKDKKLREKNQKKK